MAERGRQRRGVDRCDRRDRGASAVEGALVGSFVLGPLLLGMLYFGNYFWREQQTTLYPPRLTSSTVTGVCTTSQITARVASTVAASLYQLNKTTLDGLGISQNALVGLVGVTVSSLGSVGADVNISLSIPGGGALGGLLPGTSTVIRDLTERLSYVSVSTNGNNGTGCYP